MIGRLAIVEEERNIGLQARLIGFDREVVVSRTLDHIGSELTLGEERIGGDVLALNIDAVEQWDEHSNFIGLLGFFMAFYRQGADFFWV